MPLTFHTYTTEHEDFVLSKFPAETQEEPIPRAIVLCFTNRSGSNYLSDLLRSTGLITGLREILNWHLINKCLAENRFSSLGQFIHYQRSIDQPGARFWGFKTGWSQLLMLRQKQIIPKLVTPFFIEVRRRDKLGQAISNYIAVKTGNWSGVQSEQVSYDREAILNSLQYIHWSESQMDMVLTLLKAERHIVYYEDLLDRPNAVIGRLCEKLGVGYAPPDQSRVSTVLQRNEVNGLLRDQFLQDLEELTVNWKVPPTNAQE